MKFFHRKPGRLHPDDMQLILRRIESIMTAATDKLDTAVARIAKDIGDIADRLRTAANNDDSVAILADVDKLDASATELEGLAPAAPADPATPPATPPAGQ